MNGHTDSDCEQTCCPVCMDTPDEIRNDIRCGALAMGFSAEQADAWVAATYHSRPNPDDDDDVVIA